MFIFSAVFFGLIAVIIMYDSLVTLKHNTAKPWSTIDVLLKQRQQCISGLEEAIAGKRAFYNQSANDNNIRIEKFPDLTVARLFNFKPFDLLEFHHEEKQEINLKSLFNRN